MHVRNAGKLQPEDDDDDDRSLERNVTTIIAAHHKSCLFKTFPVKYYCLCLELKSIRRSSCGNSSVSRHPFQVGRRCHCQ